MAPCSVASPMLRRDSSTLSNRRQSTALCCKLEDSSIFGGSSLLHLWFLVQCLGKPETQSAADSFTTKSWAARTHVLAVEGQHVLGPRRSFDALSPVTKLPAEAASFDSGS
eukprot:TRINITY_DN93159_c0_g1_i1.p1 TRINITY_DN93159_c0_g1~~TRINITY_DN93159_c0_g1_i1.p1  ORF type:complete len:111 (-),score=12.16 TRINITY_DN93159_c0_g1_i1:234-566(-)